MSRHEVDRLRRDHLGGHRQVPLVFTIFVVNHDDHASGAKVGDRVIDTREVGLSALPHESECG